MYVLSALVNLFVSNQECAKTTEPIFTKFCKKVAHGLRKKQHRFW